MHIDFSYLELRYFKKNVSIIVMGHPDYSLTSLHLVYYVLPFVVFAFAMRRQLSEEVIIKVARDKLASSIVSRDVGPSL